jgi:hypothetical protein
MDQHARLDLSQLLSAATPILEAFPGEIWLAHEVVELADGKLDKPPCQGFRTNQPDSWCSIGTAVTIAERYAPGTAGVGFAIVENMVTFDFDDCVLPDGTLVPEIAGMIERLDSFGYATISGTGMRVICLNDEANPIPAGKRTCRTASRYKVEVFVGPINHYNTFSAATNGKPIAARGAVVRALLHELSSGIGDPHGPTSGSNIGEIGRTSDLGKKTRNVAALLSALQAIPHDEQIDRNMWVKLAGGVYAGTDGSDEGRAAFVTWSETWCRHDEDPEAHTEAAHTLWGSFSSTPPRSVGAGTVFKLAQQHGWRWPKENTDTRRTADADGFTAIAFHEVRVTAARDFVERLLETDSVAMVYGRDGTGKTFWVLDLVLHVAWDHTWFGLEVEGGPALMFALESQRGVEKRVAAFRQHHRLQGEQLPFKLITGIVDLSDDAAVDALIKRIRREGKEMGRRVKIVAIDTLMAALGGNGNEDNSETMNPVLANCHRIRSATGVCLLLVHHPGKDSRRGPRGFSGIRGTLSTLIEIESTDRSKPRRVIVRKQRDLDFPERDMFYRLQPVELGIDRRGRVISSCVVVPLQVEGERQTAEREAKLVKLTKQQRLAFDALHDALQQHGLRPIDGKPAARVTSMRAWREAFSERFPTGTDRKVIEKALLRARQALIESKLIGVNGRQVWLADS